MAEEIRKLRQANDILKSSEKPNIERRREYEREQEEIRLRHMRELQEVQKKKQAVQDSIDAVNGKLSANADKIAQLERLMAEKAKLEGDKKRLEEIEAGIKEILESLDAWQKARNYQQEDILFTFNAYKEGRNGVLNANDMGLGKTYESVLMMYLLWHDFQKEHGRKPRMAWFTKKSLIKSSAREIIKWWPNCPILPLFGNGTPDMRAMVLDMILQNNYIMITNYETVRTTPGIMAVDWDLIIVDEVHKLKGGANASGPTQIWSLFKELTRKTKFSLFLSGTPMVNKPWEMWSYLHIFQPEKFPKAKTFENMFTKWDNSVMKVTVDVDQLIRGALKGQVIRRRLDEVGIQMPSLTREVRILEMNEDQREAYDMVEQFFWAWLDKNQTKSFSMQNILAKLTRCRQISLWPPSIKVEVTSKEVDEEGQEYLKVVKKAMELNSSSKMDETMELIEQLAEANEQVVIFANFNEPLKEIQRRCVAAGITCETLTGDNSWNSGDYEEAFQQGKITVLACNTMVGEGMNLHKTDEWPGGASYVVLMDLWWSPAKNEQAEKRVYRPGCRHPVTSIVLQNETSVDGLIALIVQEKAEMFGNIMESEKLRPAAEWRDLLQKGLKETPLTETVEI